MSVSDMDQLFSDAMSVHSRYCDRKDKEHACAGTATIRRGEVCLDCPLCGKGEQHPWRPSVVKQAEDILAAAGLNFHVLSRDVQQMTLEAVVQAVRELQ